MWTYLPTHFGRPAHKQYLLSSHVSRLWSPARFISNPGVLTIKSSRIPRSFSLSPAVSFRKWNFPGGKKWVYGALAASRKSEPKLIRLGYLTVTRLYKHPTAVSSIPYPVMYILHVQRGGMGSCVTGSRRPLLSLSVNVWAPCNQKIRESVSLLDGQRSNTGDATVPLHDCRPLPRLVSRTRRSESRVWILLSSATIPNLKKLLLFFKLQSQSGNRKWKYTERWTSVSLRQTDVYWIPPLITFSLLH